MGWLWNYTWTLVSLPRLNYLKKTSFSLTLEARRGAVGPGNSLQLWWIYADLSALSRSSVTVPGTCQCWSNWWCTLEKRRSTVSEYSLWVSNASRVSCSLRYTGMEWWTSSEHFRNYQYDTSQCRMASLFPGMAASLPVCWKNFQVKSEPAFV